MLCNLEPKASAIKAVLVPAENATEAEPDTKVPGLACWWEDCASARTR
jgi:hypothetical protein